MQEIKYIVLELEKIEKDKQGLNLPSGSHRCPDGLQTMFRRITDDV
jgi:hypothetical protein